jgi:hypothetical protein
MTYRVLYGDPLPMLRADRHLDEEVNAEQFGTEHEALNRARQILDKDCTKLVVVRDDAGNEVSGLRLQLRLGYHCLE